MGSGCVIDLSRFGIHETTVQESVQSGSNLCLFSGDKLFGGPQAGIIVGKSNWINELRQHPMMRAMRPDKLTLAALEATTEIHLSGRAFEELPFYQMLAERPESVQERCMALRQIVSLALPKLDVEVVACKSQIGGGSLPGHELESYGIRLANVRTSKVAAALREGSPAVQCRQTQDHLVLDLRTVSATAAQQLPSLIQRSIGEDCLLVDSEVRADNSDARARESR